MNFPIWYVPLGEVARFASRISPSDAEAIVFDVVFFVFFDDDDCVFDE